MAVPFNDLHAQYLTIKPEVDAAIAKVIRGSAFVRGEEVEHFEVSFAELIGTRECVSCANGTDALYIAMHALGLKSGDEVIVPSHSWISTSETVTQAGGRVVFCDTSPSDYTIDVSLLESKITNRTVGIIPVHLYGHPADMNAVMRIAAKHNLWVIEDCAQAHLATFNDQVVGSFGDLSTFSFYPGKNLGAMGDAGAIVTNDAQLARRSARFARHGGLVKGQHEIEGINSRLDGIQAAILNAKLPHLQNWTDKRREIARTFHLGLKDIDRLTLPTTNGPVNPVWHLYVIQSEVRDSLKEHLTDRGISTVINYPVALPFLPAYEYLKASHDDFPISFHHQSRILSLPIYPEMTISQQQEVIIAVKDFFR